MSFNKINEIVNKLQSSSELKNMFVKEPVFSKTLRILNTISEEIEWTKMSDENKLSYRNKAKNWIDPNTDEYKYLISIIELTEILTRKIEKINLEISQSDNYSVNLKSEILLAILLLEKEFNLEYKNIEKLRHSDYYWFNEILSYFCHDEELKEIQILFHRMYARWKDRPWNEIIEMN